MSWSQETAESYGQQGAQGHLEIFDELITECLGPLDGQRVLDFGCGPGRLTMTLVHLGASCVVGVDESSAMIEEARETVQALAREQSERVLIRQGDETAIPELGKFDAILCSLVLMMCRTRDRLASVSRTLVQALGERGRLLVVVTHPCFRHTDYGTFRYQLPEDFRYWNSGQPYDVVLNPPQAGDEAVITDHHWTLADYVNAWSDAGGRITATRELAARYREDGTPTGPPAYLAALLEPRS